MWGASSRRREWEGWRWTGERPTRTRTEPTDGCWSWSPTSRQAAMASGHPLRGTTPRDDDISDAASFASPDRKRRVVAVARGPALRHADRDSRKRQSEGRAPRRPRRGAPRPRRSPRRSGRTPRRERRRMRSWKISSTTSSTSSPLPRKRVLPKSQSQSQSSWDRWTSRRDGKHCQPTEPGPRACPDLATDGRTRHVASSKDSPPRHGPVPRSHCPCRGHRLRWPNAPVGAPTPHSWSSSSSLSSSHYS
mmetsp:Transcript_24080/g.49271  ORF Transcript_24080/g.49271 Transcript_24080/m.49271 type:complete len:249 (-) Transcript_24080:236-982(-)